MLTDSFFNGYSLLELLQTGLVLQNGTFGIVGASFYGPDTLPVAKPTVSKH